MVVAFVGSHCTGKSVLLQEFKKNKNVVCLDSITRTTISAAERRVDGVEDLNKTQLYMLTNILINMTRIVKMNAEDPTKIYLMDRSILDFLAYSKSFLDNGLLEKSTYDFIWEKSKGVWNNIDKFFYLQPEFSIVDDGVRSLDEDLRQKVDQELFRLLNETKVSFKTLSGSIESRVEQVKNELGIGSLT